MRKSVAAKKKMRVETPGINIIGHLNHQDTTFDDNRFQNTFAELLDEVCDENRFKLKDVISAFIVPVMEAYQKRLDESFNLKEVEPSNVEIIPNMGEIGVCGFHPTMVGQAFSVILFDVKMMHL